MRTFEGFRSVAFNWLDLYVHSLFNGQIGSLRRLSVHIQGKFTTASDNYLI